jgi:hypothetical protein
MTKDEALKLALEALLRVKEEFSIHQMDTAITAIKQALAAPVQEPVAWIIWTHGPVLVFMNKDEAMLEFERLNMTYPEKSRKLKPLYTTPPNVATPLAAQPAPVQEPVAWVNRMTIDSTNELSPPAAKRQWVGISMDDIVAAVIQHGDSIRFEHDFARAIEAKLKEKNNG